MAASAGRCRCDRSHCSPAEGAAARLARTLTGRPRSQTLPSFGGIPNYVAPAINVALTNLAPQPATVWTSQANNTLPAVNGVAAITASSQYTVWGVGDHGYVVTATVPASSLHSSAGVSPSQSWTVSSAAVLASGYADLNGITWDNNKVSLSGGARCARRRCC